MKTLIGVELLRKLPPGPVDLRDTKLAGFVLRVRPNGKHSYYVNHGRGRWALVGKASVLSPPEAREQARQLLADVVKGVDPQAKKRAERSRLTFDAFIREHYEPWAIAQRKTGGETVQRLRAAFGSVLSGLRLDEISPFQIERWRSARLKSGTAAGTVNRDLGVLKSALSRAVAWRILTSNPLRDVKPSRVDKRGIVRYLSDDEETRLLAALDARDSTRRDERDSANAWRRARGYDDWPAFGTYTDHLSPLVRLALHTGLRRGELFSLHWREVDLVAARLTVRGADAKSGQTRHVPLNTEAVRVLRTWHTPNVAPSALVFPGVDGAPLVDIKSAWSALLKAASIEAFRFHDCRHDFASRLVSAGVDLNTVRELLGHADLTMTLRYAHLAPERSAAAVARLVRA